MKNSITVTSDAVAALRNVMATVEDGREAEQHDKAVRRYREEREAPWWIDVGGEGDLC